MMAIMNFIVMTAQESKYPPSVPGAIQLSNNSSLRKMNKLRSEDSSSYVAYAKINSERPDGSALNVTLLSQV
jgi:hypothetical protein